MRHWLLTVDERDDLRRFLQEIGIEGTFAVVAVELLDRVRAAQSAAASAAARRRAARDHRLARRGAAGSPR